MAQHALVYGGCGSLGSEAIRQFKVAGLKTISVDFAVSKEADHSIQIQGKSLDEDVKSILAEITKLNTGLDVIVSVAGGWVGGDIKDDGVFGALDRMWKFNTQSSVAAAHIAAKHLKEGGLLILTGAASALSPTPANIGYGLSKTAVHYLIASLSLENSGLPNKAKVFGIVPIMLDTVPNRNAMPNGDYSSWTPLAHVAQKLVSWAQGQEVPTSGSLVECKTTGGNTEWLVVKPTWI
eukprot:TRINITY_DN14642_c0_g1_i1.p1 TRINITY_DN14642_c0_g1~~TRINITY_DN14642_c0_g1_i1.p1  ORF type:complete len:237 (+),score=80.28 TRINITY_DN14642_c0_g1_i1:64-774(+)